MSTTKPSLHRMRSDLRWVILVEDGRHFWLGRSAEPLPEELAQTSAALDEWNIAAWLAILMGEYWFAHTVHVIGVRLLTRRTGSWETAVAAFRRRRDRTLAGLQQKPFKLASHEANGS